MKTAKVYILADTEQEYLQCLSVFKEQEPKWENYEPERFKCGGDGDGAIFIDGRKASLELHSNGFDICIIQ